MGVGSVEDIHSGYDPLARLYSIFKAIRKKSKEDKRVGDIDLIVVKGDIVGGHVGKELWDYQDIHDWVKCVNFVRVRSKSTIPELSKPSQESIDELVKRHPPEAGKEPDIDFIVDNHYTGLQAELLEDTIDEAGIMPIEFTYKKAETDFIQMAFVLGNQDRIFMEYVLEGKDPEQDNTINAKTSKLIKAQADYALQGYDIKQFEGIMQAVTSMGDIDHGKLKDEIAKECGATGLVLDVLTETIPALAYLKEQYEAQKEPEKQHLVVSGSKIKILETHSYPPGSDVYVSSKENKEKPGTPEYEHFEKIHMKPAKAAEMLPEIEAKLGIEGINFISYAHNHTYDEQLKVVFFPKDKSLRKVLVGSSGNSGHAIESHDSYKMATAFVTYDVAPDYCNMHIKGPI